MATKGAEKWTKYFKGQQVETVLKAAPGESIPVYDGNGKVFTKLRDGDKVTVIKMVGYESKYHIAFQQSAKQVLGYVSEKYVAKPSKKTHSVQLSGASATTFSKFGKKTTIPYMDSQMKVIAFTSPQQLENSIIAGLEYVEKDKDSAQLAFLEFFHNGYTNIPWNSEVSDSERDRYGVYVGELLIGLFYLSGVAARYMAPIPDSRQAVAFYIPDDPTFSGIDSIIQFSDGTYLPISNKFGKGAKASIFSNVMAKGLTTYGKMAPSVFRDLCIAAQQAGVTAKDLAAKRGSMPIVYEYGLRYVLGINYIHDPMTVYYALKSGNMTEDALSVITAIKHSPLAEEEVIRNLPHSVTAFFCRTIANKLNGDGAALAQMTEILSGKEFWQANLNTAKWDKGQVHFRMTSTSEMKLKIIGNKAVMSDISARQGTINYEIKPA
jgi:hypothetical protein